MTHARFTQPSASQFNLHGLNVNSPDLPSELAGFSPTVLWQDLQNSPVNYDNNGNIVDDVSCGGFGAWPDHRRKRPALLVLALSQYTGLMADAWRSQCRKDQCRRQGGMESVKFGRVEEGRVIGTDG